MQIWHKILLIFLTITLITCSKEKTKILILNDNPFKVRYGIFKTESFTKDKLRTDTIAIGRNKNLYLHGFIGNLNKESKLYSISNINFDKESDSEELLFIENQKVSPVDTVQNKLLELKEFPLADGIIYKVAKFGIKNKENKIISITFFCENEGLILTRNKSTFTKLIGYTDNKENLSIFDLINRIQRDNAFFKIK